MKKFVLLAFLFAVVTAQSSASVRFGGGAHGGLAFSSTSGPLSEFYGLGFGAGAHADIDFIRELTLRLNVDYNSFPADKELWRSRIRALTPLNVEVDGGNLSIIGVTMNAVGKIPTGSSFTPYGMFGFGLNFCGGSDLNVVIGGRSSTLPAGSSTNFGLNFGAGTEFRIGYSRLFFEAKYAIIFNKGSNIGYLPLTFGVVF